MKRQYKETPKCKIDSGMLAMSSEIGQKRGPFFHPRLLISSTILFSFDCPLRCFKRLIAYRISHTSVLQLVLCTCISWTATPRGGARMLTSNTVSPHLHGRRLSNGKLRRRNERRGRSGHHGTEGKRELHRWRLVGGRRVWG